MYPAGVNKRSKIFVPGITEEADCRAYPVFHEYIELLCTKMQCEKDEVFLCNPTTKDNVAGAEVFSCSMCCDNKTKYKPQSRDYDLFDGVKPDGTARGKFQSIGEDSSPASVLFRKIQTNCKRHSFRYWRKTAPRARVSHNRRPTQTCCIEGMLHISHPA